MTRINVIPPSELCDQMLLAEYREIPRVFNKAEEFWIDYEQRVRHAIRMSTKCEAPDLPEEYCLGEGHMKFFYRHFYYLCDRVAYLKEEIKYRGLNCTDYNLSVYSCFKSNSIKPYRPKSKDQYINRERIAQRIKEMKRQPSWSHKDRSIEDAG